MHFLRGVSWVGLGCVPTVSVRCRRPTVFLAVCVCLLLQCLECLAQGQLKARTESGRVVILELDGTWHFEDDAKKSEAAAKEKSFRETYWGMTREQVKAVEGEGAEEPAGENHVYYKRTIAGLDALTVYYFADGKLVRARYAFTEEHSNKNDYLGDFFKVKYLLEQKYGKAEIDTKWRNDLYKSDEQHWGLAASLGHLTLTSRWETAETEITEFLGGENFSVTFIAEYASKLLKGLEEEARRKAGKKDF